MIDDETSHIEIRFNCKAHYEGHDPAGSGDRLRIRLEPTSICNGVSPAVVAGGSRSRPFNADAVFLSDLEYDGSNTAGPLLILNFSKPMQFDVEMTDVSFELTVRVRAARAPVATTNIDAVPATIQHRRVVRPEPETARFVINLASMQRVPTAADALSVQPAAGRRLFYSEAVVDGATWYRLRLGDFDTAAEANTVLAGLSASFPRAWIDRADSGGAAIDLSVATLPAGSVAESASGGETPDEIDALMEDARRAMIAGDTSLAVQIYTKVLQLPDHDRAPEAQEYLAFAREKKGQRAHAKAEYERYLSLYPDEEGATRVAQRLAALLAGALPASQPADVRQNSNSSAAAPSKWRIQSYFSQYYRRDVNQPTDQEEFVSQSALYSDINLDARRRGERFDFSSRLSAGYRSDLLNSDVAINSGNSTRITYAYADLADARTGLRGRLGRQSRNTGGVLGRFDGLNLAYQLNEKVLLAAVAGAPVYSLSNSDGPLRSFYGLSANYGPLMENLELGAFYIQQNIEGITDRKAIGGELRYFGNNQSLWGMLDYDIHFGELTSAFLQGSWRFESRFSVHAMLNKRGSPFLSTGNAIIGQPVGSFAELTEIFSAAELMELGRDRTADSTNMTVGLSYPVTPRLQVNADAGRSSIAATPESGGVLATPGSTYAYYSTSLLASSLITEGDVTIVGMRYSDSDTSSVISATVDSRYPIGRNWRINARFRVDRRELIPGNSSQWLYTPELRIQYRRSQRFRLEFDAGKMFSQQDSENANQDRESYFINIGYQVFF